MEKKNYFARSRTQKAKTPDNKLSIAQSSLQILRFLFRRRQKKFSVLYLFSEINVLTCRIFLGYHFLFLFFFNLKKWVLDFPVSEYENWKNRLKLLRSWTFWVFLLFDFWVVRLKQCQIIEGWWMSLLPSLTNGEEFL